MAQKRTVERLMMASIVVLQLVIIAMLVQDRRLPRHEAGAVETPSDWPVAQRPATPFEAMNAMMGQAVHDMERMSALIAHRASWERVLPTPAVDMRETDDEYVVVMALPSVGPDQIEVFLKGRLLTVLGGSASPDETFPPTPLIRQRVQLPGPVGDALLAKAMWTNGVLKVCLPKALVTATSDSDQPRRIY
jgi:HSP20 family molecular chaperone IbpA